MDSTPTSGSEPLVPPTRRAAAAAAVRELSRSRRAQTFGLGALCGALALSLLIVVTTIFAAQQTPGPLGDEPAPVSEERVSTPTPTRTPPASTPVPTRTPTPDATVEPQEPDAAPDPVVAPEPSATQVPAPEPEPGPESTPTPTAPGNSGNAPGHNKKKP
jgi:outer membrane biosynthesis protein TonB